MLPHGEATLRVPRNPESLLAPSGNPLRPTCCPCLVLDGNATSCRCPLPKLGQRLKCTLAHTKAYGLGALNASQSACVLICITGTRSS